MELVESIFKKKFIKGLRVKNQIIMEKAHVGSDIKIDCVCNSVIIGKIENFYEDAISIKISKKSKVLVGSSGVLNIVLA